MCVWAPLSVVCAMETEENKIRLVMSAICLLGPVGLLLCKQIEASGFPQQKYIYKVQD
jgi:hypothetical protein